MGVAIAGIGYVGGVTAAAEMGVAILVASVIYLLFRKQRQFGQASWQVIEECKNWEKEMGEVEQLYTKLIERYRK